MKFTFDTNNKTIQIEERVNLEELSKALDSMFPNFKWFEFDLIPNIVGWVLPPLVVPWDPTPQPTYPWITYSTLHADPNNVSMSDTCTYALIKGIFNIDLEVPNE